MNLRFWPFPVPLDTEFHIIRASAFHRKAELLESLISALKMHPKGHEHSFEQAYKHSKNASFLTLIASIEDTVVISKILTCLDDKVTPVETAQLPQCRAPLATGLFD